MTLGLLGVATILSCRYQEVATVEESNPAPREFKVAYCQAKALSFLEMDREQLGGMLVECNGAFLKDTRNILERRFSDLSEIEGGLQYALETDPFKNEPITDCYAAARWADFLTLGELEEVFVRCNDVYTESVKMQIVRKIIGLENATEPVQQQTSM